MASSSDTIVLYHHTDSDSAKLIIKHGFIKQSGGGGRDAYFGDGVYLTELDPSVPSSIVAKNNYDNVTKVWTNMLGKTEVAIKIRIKKSKVEQCSVDRNVYLHRGDLYLSEVEKWVVIPRE